MPNAHSVESAKTAMIVDDDPHLRELLASYLNAQNYDVVATKSAKEAIARFPECKPAVVFLDLMLGDALGTSVERAIRAHPLLYDRTAVVYQTCIGDAEDRPYLLTHHADFVLTKPYRACHVVEALNAAERNLALQHHRSKTTGLAPTIAGIRRIDHLLTRGEAFEVILLADRSRRVLLSKGNGELRARRQAIGEGLRATLKRGPFYETTAYDLGAGMFLIVLQGDSANRFLRMLETGFAEDAAKSPASAGIRLHHVRKRVEPAESRPVVMELMHDLDGELRDLEREGASNRETVQQPAGHDHWF